MKNPFTVCLSRPLARQVSYDTPMHNLVINPDWDRGEALAGVKQLKLPASDHCRDPAGGRSAAIAELAKGLSSSEHVDVDVGHWHNHGLGVGCQRRRSIRLLRTAVVHCLPGSGPAAELIGRQGPARPCLEDGQWLSEKAARRGRARCNLPSRAPTPIRYGVGGEVDGNQALQTSKLVAVAVANKLARIVFAVMKTGTSYRNKALPEDLLR